MKVAEFNFFSFATAALLYLAADAVLIWAPREIGDMHVPLDTGVGNSRIVPAEVYVWESSTCLKS
jgi:hypothetical protein